MVPFATPVQWILAVFLIASSLGIILFKKPVHACLSFLGTLLLLAAFYLELSAQFIAIMQVLIYAGAILVIFMFVIILFQDAYQRIGHLPSKSSPLFLGISCFAFLVGFILLGKNLLGLPLPSQTLPKEFGSVEVIGRALYLDFFFPFEAVIFLFLIALVGALYIGRRSE